jgi:hypothetical protein
MPQQVMQDIIRKAQVCSIANRMPSKLEELAADIGQLDKHSLEQLQWCLVSRGLAGRMARRAAQAAPSNVIGANRIINSMFVIFGRESTVNILREVEYDRHVAACARRFATKFRQSRLGKAQELHSHLRDLFGDGPHIHELGEIVRRAMSPAITAA